MRIDVYHHSTNEHQMNAIQHSLCVLIKQGELIMETLQTIKEKLVALGQAVVDEKTEVQGKLGTLTTQIAELGVEIQTLKDQIAAGALVTQADLDALGLSVDEISLGVKDVSEPFNPPVVPEV